MSEISQLALISLGSNDISVLGDTRVTVQKAMQKVAQITRNTAKKSNLYATPAFPPGAGPDFVNAAMAFETDLLPHELLSRLHAIEAEAGRVRTQRWGQRTLDLDLIALGAHVLPNRAEQTRWRDLSVAQQQQTTPTQLILPHPRMQDRSFVLVPLNDIAPDWQHPILGETIASLCAALSNADRASVRRLGAADISLNTP